MDLVFGKFPLDPEFHGGPRFYVCHPPFSRHMVNDPGPFVIYSDAMPTVLAKHVSGDL